MLTYLLWDQVPLGLVLSCVLLLGTFKGVHGILKYRLISNAIMLHPYYLQLHFMVRYRVGHASFIKCPTTLCLFLKEEEMSLPSTTLYPILFSHDIPSRQNKERKVEVGLSFQQYQNSKLGHDP